MESAVLRLEEQYESQDSPSEELPEAKPSSEVWEDESEDWEEVSDQTEAADADAEDAIEVL